MTVWCVSCICIGPHVRNKVDLNMFSKHGKVYFLYSYVLFHDFCIVFLLTFFSLLDRSWIC